MNLVIRKDSWLTSACQEMASRERQNANRKIAEENLFNSFGAAEKQAETDAFQCGRCKQVSWSMMLRVPFADVLRRENAVIARRKLVVLMSP
jgi:hypothetical protein